MDGAKTVAVILAAGEGRRMGTPKALLEYAAGQSFLDRLAEVFRAAGCDALGVVGKDASRVRELHPGLATVENPGWGAGQLSSARVGLERALELGAGRILLCPVDQPALLPSSAEAVRGALGPAEVAVASYGGQRGHPLGLTRGAAEELLAMRDVPHLEAALARLAVREVPVDDPAVTGDLDTPEEYRRFFGRLPRPVQR